MHGLMANVFLKSSGHIRNRQAGEIVQRVGAWTILAEVLCHTGQLTAIYDSSFRGSDPSSL